MSVPALHFAKPLIALTLSVAAVVLAVDAPSESNAAAQVVLVARDHSGNPTDGVKAEDITVLDNGSPVTVSRIESADKVPLRLGIILLSSGPSFKSQQEAAVRLLTAMRAGVDQAFVITRATSSGSHSWPKAQLTWDSDPTATISLVRSLRWDMSLPDATSIANQMLALDSGKTYRSVLVEFRDPGNEAMLEWGQMPYKELEATQQKEIAECQRLRAAVYTFALEDSYSQRVTGKLISELSTVWRHGEQKIERLAEETGGRYFQNTGNFKSEIAQIQNDLQRQMVLTFLLKASSDQDAAHKLEIRVNRQDLHIASQKRFFPPHP